jgi:hypothetical protein
VNAPGPAAMEFPSNRTKGDAAMEEEPRFTQLLRRARRRAAVARPCRAGRAAKESAGTRSTGGRPPTAPLGAEERLEDRLAGLRSGRIRPRPFRRGRR